MRQALLMLAAALLSAASIDRAGAEPTKYGITPSEYDTVEFGVTLLRKALAQTRYADLDRAAAAGDVEAQYLTGIALRVGFGAPKSLAEARKRLQRAALGGFRRAATTYGQMLYFGEGGDKDVESALTWWQAAADAGSPTAMGVLAEYFRNPAAPAKPNLAKARDYYRQAAEKGNLGALVGVADLSVPDSPQPSDLRTAFDHYLYAVERGSIIGLYKVGLSYREGWGVAKNPALAVEYLERAAKAGHVDALITVARDLAQPTNGRPPEAARAVRLLVENAAPDNWAARDYLAVLLIRKATPPIKGIDAEALATSASENGRIEAMTSLIGNLREGKLGYPRDLVRAAGLARALLTRVQALPMSEEAAWPMNAKGLAYTIQVAIRAKAVEAKAGEEHQLERRYGKPDGRMVWMDAKVSCGGPEGIFRIYLWDVDSLVSPSDAQFDWAEQSRACTVPLAERLYYRRLFDLSRATGKSYPGLAVERITAGIRPLSPPIAF